MPFVYPRSIVMTTILCDYCNKEYMTLVRTVNELSGIKACTNHKTLAERHVKAWFHSNNAVPLEDVLKLYDLPDGKIRVPRSNGTITQGGSFVKSTYDYGRFVRKDENGEWIVDVAFNDPAPMNKSIQVKKLVLSEISTDLVNRLLEHLDKGFFKADYEASLLDRADPSVPLVEDSIYLYNSEQGPVRVLVPPVKTNDPISNP